MSGQRSALLDRIVDLEMAGAIESWGFLGDAVQVMFVKAAECCHCRTMHFYFVNRDGRTRCVECDDTYLREREMLRPNLTTAGAGR